MQYPTAGFRVLALASLCYIGASCGTIPDVGLAERCADIMRRAYPSASIDITKREASATGMTTIMATVEGVRADLAPDQPLAQNLAVECRFDENILTGFRWTAGPKS